MCLPAGGPLNYSVNQGDTLTVTFKGFSSSYAFLGGSLNDYFVSGTGCYLTASTTPTTSLNQNSIASTVDTGFVFSPTGAVCSQVPTVPSPLSSPCSAPFLLIL